MKFSINSFRDIRENHWRLTVRAVLSSCDDNKDKCTIIKGQEFHVPDEDKKLRTILAKAVGSSDARDDVLGKAQLSRM